MKSIDVVQLLRDTKEAFDDAEEASVPEHDPGAGPTWSPSPDLVRKIDQAIAEFDKAARNEFQRSQAK